MSDAPPSSAEKPAEEEGEGGKPMTFWEHLEELRVHLIRAVAALVVGCIIAWAFHGKILSALKIPFNAGWVNAHLPGDPALHQSTPAGAFTAYIKLSMIGGAALASPVIFYQLWSFVAPGLYAREKKYVIPFVGLSSMLFVTGGWFAWRVAIPLSFRFFLGEAADPGAPITPTIMVGDYIDFCLQLMLGFGLIFELPMLLLFLSVAGVINYLTLLRYGRWFIFLSFVVSAVLTPPDAISMLVMAVPMCLLYAVSIGLVYLFGKRPSEAEREAWKKRKEKDEGATSSE